MQNDLIREENGNPQSFFINYRSLFLLLSSVMLLVFSIYEGSLAIYPCFILFGCIGCMLSAFRGRNAVKLFTTTYSISCIFAIVFFIIFKVQNGTPYHGGGSDSLAYEIYASEIKNAVFNYDAEAIGEIINAPYHNSKGYIYLVSLLMRLSDLLGGFHTMIPRLFNASLLGGCSVIVYSIAKKISLTSAQALNSALVTGLFPIMIYISVQTFRDIGIVFILLLSVYFSISIINSKSMFKRLILILLFIPLLLIITQFRLANTINLGIVLVIACLVKFFSVKRIFNRQILFAFAGLIIIYLLLLPYDLPLIFDLIARLDSSQSALSEGLDRASEGGLSLIIFNLPVPFNYLGSLFYSFITPLPIIYTADVGWNFLSIGTIYQFIFIPFIFAGLKNTYRSGLMLPLLVMFLLCFGGYVFGSFTYRHITYIVPFAAIYSVIGYEKHKKQRWVIWPVMLGGLFLLILAYYFIKL